MHLVVAVSDLHAGSTVAVAPPEGVELDDGGREMPNRVQSWLYERWTDAWDRYGKLLKQYKPKTRTLMLLGDMVDGIHHGTPQVSPLVGQHFRTAHTLLKRGPLRFKLDAVHMVRGTESHVGRSGELEEGIARTFRAEGLPMVEDPTTGQVSSFWRKVEIDGVQFDLRHHGRRGQRAHTRGPYDRWYAQDIELEHRLDGERPPDIALRGHLHTFGDSGKNHRWTTRLIQLPCWQMLTAYGHRITIESMPDIGIVCFVIEDGRLHEPVPMLYKPDRPEVIT